MARSNRTYHTTPRLYAPDADQISLHEAGGQEWLSRADAVLLLGGVATVEMRHVAEVTAISRAWWYRGDWISFCDTDCSTNCSPHEDDLECNKTELIGQETAGGVEKVRRLSPLQRGAKRLNLLNAAHRGASR